MNQGRRSELFFALTVMLFAAWFSERHVRLDEWVDVDFAHLVAGTAKTPMQYRVLLPWIARQALDSPVSLLNRWELGQLRYALNVLSTIGLLYAARLLWHALGYTRPQAMLASGLIAVMLPFQFLLPAVRLHYSYDIAAVMFFTLGLAALVLKHWPLFYLAFIVGTFNRETTAFLVPIYLLAHAGRERWAPLLGHAAVLTAIWVAIKAWLWTIYGGNTDPAYADGFDLFKTSWAENVMVLRTNPRAWLWLTSNWTFLWIPALFAWRHPGVHVFVRRALWIVPVFVGAMLLVGEVREMRIFGEMIPVIAAGALGVLSSWLWRQPPSVEQHG